MPIVGQAHPEATDFTGLFGGQPEAPGLFGQLGAAWQTATFAGQAARNIGQDFDRLGAPRDPNFDVLQHLTPDELTEPAFFGKARSAEDLEDLRREHAARQNIEAAFAAGPLNPLVAGLVAGVADPTNFILPGVALGKGVAAAAASVAATGVATAGLDKAINPDTSWQDAAILGATAAVFGTAIHAAGAAIKGGSKAALSRATKDTADAVNRDPVNVIVGGPGSLSSAATPKGLDPYLTEQVKGLRVGATKGITPVAEDLGLSEIPEARELLHTLFDTGTFTNGEMVGVRAAGPSIRTAINSTDAMLVNLYDGMRGNFTAARAAKSIPDDWSYEAFGRAVVEAAVNGDRHAVPEVQKMAETIRKELLEPIRQRIERTGIIDLPQASKGDETYFPRSFLRDRIVRGATNGKGETFEEAVARGFMDRDGMDPVLAQQIAEEVSEKIRGSASARAGRFTLRERGNLKERSLDLPFKVLAPWLDTNPDVVLTRYLRSVVPDLLVYKTFGTLDANKIVEPVRAGAERLRSIAKNAPKTEADYKAALAKAEAATWSSPEEKAQVIAQIKKTGVMDDEKLAKRMAAIQKMQDDAIEKLGYLLGELRGTNTRSNLPDWGKASIRGLKTAGYMAMMANVALAQIGDLGVIALREGLHRTVGPMMATAFNALAGRKTKALAEAMRTGAGLDWRLNTRMKEVFDLGDEFEMSGKASRAFAGASNAASRIFLINMMTAANKSIAAGAVIDRTLGAAIKTADHLARNPALTPHEAMLAAVPKADVRLIAQGRLTAEDLLAIAGERKHFGKEGGLLAANSAEWENGAAQRAFRLALNQGVEAAVITPTAVDSPMWANSEIGKIVLTYQRFALASYHRIMVSMTQMRDARAMVGFVTALGLGAVSLALRDMATKGEVQQRTSEQWVRDSFDRGGVASLYFMGENMLTNSGLPTSQTLVGYANEPAGADFQSRWKRGRTNADPLKALEGPLGKYATDAMRGLSALVGAAAGEEELTQRQVHSMTGLLPFRRMMGVSMLVDKFEQEGARRGWWKPLQDDPRYVRVRS